MKILLGSILSVIGPGKLLAYAWSVAKPQLEEWARDDGKEDWDDALVRVIDNLVIKISSEIK